MPIVYIVNRGGHNYSDAERFGELVFCTEGTIDKLDTAQMYRQLNEALADSIPEDYILLTSLTSLCSIACAIFAHKHGSLNLLIHTSDGYISRHMLFNEVGETSEQRGKRKQRAAIFDPKR